MNDRFVVQVFDDGEVAARILDRKVYGRLETMHLNHHRLDASKQSNGFLNGCSVVQKMLNQHHHLDSRLAGVPRPETSGPEVDHVQATRGLRFLL